jgi:alpha-ketoglutarate-dependent taurine dioxygenase
MQTTTLSDVMGVEVRGVDPSGPLSESEVAELRALFAHHHMVLERGSELTRVPENEYVHQWRPHDVLIWDNLALQHGRPTKVSKEPRDFWRLKTY